jgi:hypothetical protein
MVCSITKLVQVALLIIISRFFPSLSLSLSLSLSRIIVNDSDYIENNYVIYFELLYLLKAHDTNEKNTQNKQNIK